MLYLYRMLSLALRYKHEVRIFFFLYTHLIIASSFFIKIGFSSIAMPVPLVKILLVLIGPHWWIRPSMDLWIISISLIVVTSQLAICSCSGSIHTAVHYNLWSLSHREVMCWPSLWTLSVGWGSILNLGSLSSWWLSVNAYSILGRNKYAVAGSLPVMACGFSWKVLTVYTSSIVPLIDQATLVAWLNN